MKKINAFLVPLLTIALCGAATAADIRKVSFEGCDGCDSYGGSYGSCPGQLCSNGCRGGSGGTGMCSMRDRWQALNTNWCAPCGPVGKAARLGVPGAAKLCWCCNTKAFPDSGWAPPMHVPETWRARGFQSWYGNDGPFVGGAPMVYQPTDTTQLGYSYANVPTWGRKPHMIPPVPQPSAFHNRGCPCGHHGGCLNNFGHGVFIGHGHGSFCPTCGPGVVMATSHSLPVSQAPQMVAVRRVPPSVAGRQASPGTTARAFSQQPRQQTVTPVSARVSQARKRPAASASRGRSAGRSGRGRNKSGGWFGLPSLSEIQF